jgi:hypothetical protein
MNNLYRDENNKIKILNSGVKHVDMTKVQDKLLLGKLPYGKLPFDKRPSPGIDEKVQAYATLRYIIEKGIKRSMLCLL